MVHFICTHFSTSGPKAEDSGTRVVSMISACHYEVFPLCSGSSGGSGGRENSGNSVGIPLAVPTPSPPSMAPG